MSTSLPVREPPFGSVPTARREGHRHSPDPSERPPEDTRASQRFPPCQDGGMSTSQPPRSVKFSDDERGGWSSDRPRRDGAAQRPADVSTRCRTLTPSDRLRYSPGSLVLIVSPSAGERDRFAGRVLE